MTSSMQPGKTYRMRQEGGQTYTDGCFKDNGYFDGPEHKHRVGWVDEKGDFYYRMADSVGEPRFRDDLAGHIDGLILTDRDNLRYELIEVDA